MAMQRTSMHRTPLLVVDVPTPEDLRGRDPIDLDERDRQILVAVHDLGFLTTAQIARAFFPDDAADREGSLSPASDRLRLLWLWAYLDRITPSFARVYAGQRSYVYTLGKRGIATARAAGRENVAALRRRRIRLDTDVIERANVAGTVWADLMDRLRPGQPTFGKLTLPVLERWIPAHQVRAWGPGGGAWFGSRPVFRSEGIGIIRHASGSGDALYLIVDLPGEPIDSSLRAVRVVEQAVRDGGLAARIGPMPVTVVVVADAHRLDDLWKSAREEVAAARHGGYRFATTEEVIEYGSFLVLWVDLDDRERPLLRRVIGG